MMLTLLLKVAKVDLSEVNLMNFYVLKKVKDNNT